MIIIITITAYAFIFQYKLVDIFKRWYIETSLEAFVDFIKMFLLAVI